MTIETARFARSGPRERRLAGRRCTGMPRALWKAQLKIKLIGCDVKLYSLLNAAEQIHFHILNRRTKNRIKLVPTDPETGDEIERPKLVRGYEFEKGRYVVVDKNEIDKLQAAASRVIEVERFVDADAVDIVYLDHPYVLGPDGKKAEETYRVIREALVRGGKVGIGRMVFHGRERRFELRPWGKGLRLTTLHSKDEVRSSDAFFEEAAGEAKTKKVDAEMVELAELIMEKKAGDWHPEEVKDRYEEHLHELIEAKLHGRKPVIAKPARPKATRNLKEALRAALAAEDGKVVLHPALAAKHAAIKDEKPDRRTKTAARRRPAAKPSAAKRAKPASRPARKRRSRG